MIQFLGACNNLIVLELLPRGSLDRLLYIERVEISMKFLIIGQTESTSNCENVDGYSQRNVLFTSNENYSQRSQVNEYSYRQ